MAEVRLTPAAQGHLVDIWAYTSEQWGEEQADSYLRNMESGLRRLAANPGLGKPRPELKAQCRSLPMGSHVVFYLPGKGGIDVIGVLHARMDVEDWLKPGNLAGE